MSDKLENALNAETIDWEQVVRIFRRLRSIKHIHMYMCRMVPECSVEIVDALMDLTRTKGYHEPHHLAQLISLIWTRILTGKDILFNLLTLEEGIRCDHEVLGEWKETFLTAYKNWEKVGDEIRVPNIENVVEALSKTALIVRALPRPMNAAVVPTACKVSKQGNSKVRITQIPSMPIVHFFVFQNLPPIIVYLAALVYPEQLGQRDAWGNVPLHYANLSAKEWTNWRPRIMPFNLQRSCLQTAAPLINLRSILEQNLNCSSDSLQSDDTGSGKIDECIQSRKSSSVSDHDSHDATSSNSFIQHLVHETVVLLLVTLRTQSILSKCHAGRLPLQTYLLSLLDYRRQESQCSHILPYRPGITWHFIHKDVELYLQHYPPSVHLRDPQLHCLPFLYPSLFLGSRNDAVSDVAQENRRAVRLLTQEISLPSWHDDEDIALLTHGGIEPDADDDLQVWSRPNEDPFMDALVVSLTYTLLRSYPQACEFANRNATEASMWSMYERELHGRWRAKTRQLQDLLAGSKVLESKLLELTFNLVTGP